MSTEKQLARKYDEGKPRFDLIPAQPLWEIAEVLTISGECKYTPRDWEKGIRWRKVFSSIMRHLYRWFQGEDMDSDTGKSHLAHAVAQILFLMEFSRTHKELDDRIVVMEERKYE